MRKIILSSIILLVVASCQMEEKKPNTKLETIVCTTGMIGDAVKNIVNEKVKVVTLMGPGVDPHLYKATQGDLKALQDADVIVYNGLHLEGKMGEVFEKLKSQKDIIVAAEGVDGDELINNTDFQGAQDPHLWFDVNLWSKVVKHIGDELSKYGDTLNKEIPQNTQAYVAKLKDLHNALEKNLGVIEKDKRVLITAHDAFGYFGRAYGFEVKGLQGISTTSEYGLKDISDLVNFITKREIKAVFVESSVSEKSLLAVVEGCKERGHEVKIGGTLYSDAMGKEGTTEGTYVGMVKSNAKTIINGLK